MNNVKNASVLVPKDCTALELPEIERTIKLYEKEVTDCKVMVELAQEPYDAAFQEHEELRVKFEAAQEKLKAAGAELSTAKLDLSRAENTLNKFLNMRDGKRGGMMFRRDHCEGTPLADYQKADGAGEKTDDKPRTKEFLWCEAAAEVLAEAKRFMEPEQLMDAILRHRPAYRAKLNMLRTKARTHALYRAAQNIQTTAHKKEEDFKRGRKVLAYHMGRIGLWEWMQDNGEPKPEFVLFKGGSYMNPTTEAPTLVLN